MGQDRVGGDEDWTPGSQNRKAQNHQAGSWSRMAASGWTEWGSWNYAGGVHAFRGRGSNNTFDSFDSDSEWEYCQHCGGWECRRIQCASRGGEVRGIGGERSEE